MSPSILVTIREKAKAAERGEGEAMYHSVKSASHIIVDDDALGPC
jgi:hypothetical protein